MVTTTPVCGRKVVFNEPAVQQYITRYAGFQVLLSTHIKDPITALQVYRDKDIIEKCLSDLKNSLDMKRLRMHTIETVDGRFFIQFIALILIRYEGEHDQILTEVTKPQREILSSLRIAIPGSA